VFLAESFGVDRAFADLIRRLLVLAVDHELDATTYAVRAAANTGITPYFAVVSGLAASRGRRLSYGRVESVVRLLDEICTARNPRTPILQRFRQGEPIAGFGTNVHRVADPRATHLLEAMTRVLRKDVEFQRVLRAADQVMELKKEPVDFILLSTFIGRKLGLKGQEIGIAGLGRIVGWIAHASEQYQAPTTRSRAHYAGALPQDKG
jgi:citrate synthase